MGVEHEVGTFEMSSAEYFALPHLSQSFLKLYLSSPFHAKYPRHRESTPDQEFGTEFHALLMEPELFANNYMEEPAYFYDGRTKEGKQERAAAAATAEGRSLIKSMQWKLLMNMREATVKCPVAGPLFASGKAEQVLLWQDELGLPCKARIDWLPDAIQNCIVDVKTTSNGKPESLQRSILDWGYHIQDAFYRRGWRHVFGKSPDFIFSFHEKPKHVDDRPLPPVLVELDDRFRQAGDKEVERLLMLHNQCVANDHWPSYTNGLITLTPPYWFKD